MTTILASSPLGKTGITVSRLALGTLTMSPLQRNLSVTDGAAVVLAALEGGIRFIDTAQMYGSYPQVAAALRQWRGDRVILASKSAAKTAEAMRTAVEEARTALNRDHIEVFLLHAVRNGPDLNDRAGAIDVLLEARRAGTIGAVGLTSHWAAVFRSVLDDARFEVFHPMFNQAGFGILDTDLAGMSDLLAQARGKGKGIYAMKPLGGGHLGSQASTALPWILDHPLVDAAAVGMTTREEVAMNLALARHETVRPDLVAAVQGQERQLFINQALCQHCGRCVEDCPQEALHLEEGIVKVALDRCVRCGYCAPRCPGFAIRII